MLYNWKKNLILAMLLAAVKPLSIVEEDEGGGGDEGDSSSDDSGPDWGELSAGVAPGADDGGGGDDPLPDASVTDPSKAKKPAESAPKAKAKEGKAQAEESEGEGEEDDPDAEATEAEGEEGDAEGEESEEADENEEEETPAVPTALTPEQQAERTRQYGEWLERETVKLEKVYELSEEDASALETEPGKVLPRLAAKLHLQVMQNLMAMQEQMIPQTIQQMKSLEATELKARALFFGKNPDLKDKNIDAEVVKVGAIYRQLHPKATPEVAAVEIGKIIRGGLGTAKPKAKAGAKAPAKPHRPLNGSGSRPAPAKAKVEGTDWGDLAGDRGS